MRAAHLPTLRCPCSGPLSLEGSPKEEILEGILRCQTCQKTYPIISGVPRFTEAEHYADTFGFEWQKHSLTQYDSVSGQGASEKRLFRETKWPRLMPGEVILEAGSGSGRFTEVLLKTGALVASVDASAAASENWRSHGSNPNVLIVQADLLSLPFAKESFDRVLCLGVLQHTKNPREALATLVSFLKPGGFLAADIYDKPSWYKRIFNTRYWIRPVTRRLPPQLLYKFVTWYVSLLWPLVRLIHKLPYGTKINHKLLVAEHLSYKNLSSKAHLEWAILDTFDWLSPRYEWPQNIGTMKRWCASLPLKDVDVTPGYGGVEIRAVRV